MADFAVGDFQLPADFEQQIASQLAANGYNFAVQPPTGQTPAPPATAASAHQFEVAAGGEPAYNPDFAVSGKTGRVSERGMGANPEDPYSAAGVPVGTFATFGNTGIPYGENNGRYFFGNDTMSAPEFETLKAGAQSRSDPLFSAKPTEIAPGVTYNPAGQTDLSTPTITTTSSAPFDYSTLRAGEPQLQPASGQYATPYYAAYTNDGDLAGAVMVAPGQKIRMIDPTNGNLIFESEGPEGAKQAVALANSLSQEKGRKAAWQIQAQNEQGGYTTQAAERYDPKKPSLIGKLATIALPMVLGAIFPPLATLGTTLTGLPGLAGTMANVAALNTIAGTGVGLAKGQNLGDAFKGGLQQGALAGATAGLMKGLPVGVQNVLNTPQRWLNQGVQTVLDRVPVLDKAVGAINSGLRGGIGAVRGVTQPVFSAGRNVLNTFDKINPLTIVGNALHPGVPVAPSVPGANTGTLLSEIVATGAPTVGVGTTGALANAASSLMGGMNRASFPEITPDGSVDTVEVFKPDVSDLGIPFNPFPGGGTQVSGVESTGKRNTSVPGVPGGGGTPPSGTGDTGTSTPPKTEPPKTEPPKTTPPDQPIIPLLPIDLQPNDNGKGYSFAVGPGTPGTRGSLGSVYSAKLPAPWERYAARRPNDMSGTDWKRYGMGPERSFFGVVPQSTPVSDLSGGRSSSGGASEYPAFAVVQNRLAADSGRGPAPEGKRYIQRDDGVILLVDDSPEATYTGRSGATKKVRDLSVYQGGFTTKPISDFAAANLPEVIANLRKVGGLPMRRGGFAVQGDGDGREDAIPARLSDGEYVIDAETVALLGNGSSKAGAAKLDKFRVNVRKHKGRELAKGKFSASAKDPAAYLAGGRS